MKNTVTNLKKLQSELKRKGIKAYYITPSDEHNSENVPDVYLSERLFYCPFTGTDGTLLVTQDAAYLFTDGRYFIQAEEELKDSEVTLVKPAEGLGFESLSPSELVAKNNLYPLAFDFKRVSVKEAMKFYDSGNPLTVFDDIIDENFSSLLPFQLEKGTDKVWEVTPDLTSVTREERIAKLRQFLINSGDMDGCLITDLAQIAYLLNLRGNDIRHTPVFYAFVYIDLSATHLFIDKSKIEGIELKDVTIHDYEEIYSFLTLVQELSILYDPASTNLAIANKINHSINGPIPVELNKIVKDPIEMKNIHETHILDGVAMVKFIKYLYEHSNDGLTEHQLAEVLANFRLENKRCFDLSFDSIVAVDGNAAMMHYAPTKEKSSKLDKNSHLILVDSGGQYYGGTTDITRTFLFNDPSEEIRRNYTLTLKSLISLSTSVFLEGCSGMTLDMKAREIMWREGLDYQCGTGHGVGYMLGVHEGPNAFRYYIKDKNKIPYFYALNIVTTVEPGVYKEKEYGIRIENEIVTVPYGSNNNGNFLTFECITCCPIETKYLMLDLLTNEEIEYLNGYHEWVYNKLSPLLDEEHKAFLKGLCEPVIKE